MENKIEQKEIVAVSSVPEGIDLASDDIQLIVERAEKQVAVLDKVLAIAVKRTNKFDWIDQNGKPYLTASGCEKLLTLFGISILAPSYQKITSKDEKGEYYYFVHTAQFRFHNIVVSAIGTRSSRDKFFAWDSKERAFSPLYEIDEVNILKSAYTNMIQNGIKSILGIRSLTWEQIEQFGINKAGVASIKYKAGAKTKDEATSEEIKTEVIELKEKIMKKTDVNGKWVKYSIKVGDRYFNTFSESIAKQMKELQECDLKAKVEYKATQYGCDIISLAPVESQK